MQTKPQPKPEETKVALDHSVLLQALRQALRYGLLSLFLPGAAMREAVEEKPVFGCWLLNWLQGLSFYLAVRYVHEHEGSVHLSIVPVLPSWFWVIVYAMIAPHVLWFIKGAVLNLTAELLGGPPRGLSILCSSACAFSPMLLFLPVALVAGWWWGGDFSRGGALQAWTLWMVASIGWVSILSFLAVRETYRFSVTQTIWTLFLTLVASLLMTLLIKWGTQLMAD